MVLAELWAALPTWGAGYCFSLKNTWCAVLLSGCPMATFPCPVGPERLDLPNSLASVDENTGAAPTPLISYHCLIETLTRGVGNPGEQRPRNRSGHGRAGKTVGSKRKNQTLLPLFHTPRRAAGGFLPCFQSCVVCRYGLCVRVALFLFCFWLHRKRFKHEGKPFRRQHGCHKAKLPVFLFSPLPFRPIT